MQTARPPSSPPGPAEAAAASELAAAVTAVLGDLAPHYRQVLALRLMHDLQPAQIAHTLGCPPETVKTRLRRGLDLLRRRLPAGFTPPASLLVVCLAQGRGLAAVRDNVLRAAVGRPTVLCSLLPLPLSLPLSFSLPLSLPILLGGLVAMKKILFAGAITAVLLLLAGFALFGPDRALASDVPGTPVPPPLQAGSGPVAAAAPAAIPAVTREALSVPGANEVLFAGRCVAAEDGSALAGCDVSLALADDPRAESGDFTSFPTTPLVAVRTGSDGRFELRSEHRQGACYQLGIDREDRLGRRRMCTETAPGQRLDFGDLRLRRGTRVSGQVVDRQGHPFGGGRFRLPRRDQVRFEAFPECRYAAVSIDAAGRFAVDQPLTPGEWTVWFLGADDIRLAEVHIEARPNQHLELVAPVDDDRQTLRGTVRDPSGRPIRTFWIAATGAGTYGHAWTAQDGSFTILRRGPYDAAARGPVELELKDPHERWRLAGGPISTAWGSSGLDVVVREAAHAVVRAIDGRTGRPMRAFDAYVAAVRDGEAGAGPKAYAAEQDRLENGDLHLRGLGRGAHVLRIEPADPGLAASALVRFEPTAADDAAAPRSATDLTPIVVELVPPIELPVQLVDAGGEPVADSRVQAFQAFGASGPPAIMQFETVSKRPSSMHWYNGGTTFQPIGTARTAADGCARLRAAAGGEHWLWLRGPGHIARVHGPVTATAGMQPLRIEVVRGAGLRGRIGPEEVLARLGTTPAIEDLRPMMNPVHRTLADQRATKLLLRRVAEEQDPEHWQSDIEVPVGADGSFAHRGLPAGTYEVIFRAVLPHGMYDGQRLDTTLARVQLRDGETAVLERDLPFPAPGRLRGQILVNGEPYARRQVYLAQAWRAGEHANLILHLDAEGRFEAELMPGDYMCWIFYHTPGNISTGYWRSPPEATVRAGMTTEHTFRMRRVAAHVRILNADGSPAPGLQVKMETDSEPMGWTSWTSDADGWITIVPAPPGPFALLVAHPNPAQGLAARRPGAAKDAWLDTLRIPATGNEVRFEQRLPEGWR